MKNLSRQLLSDIIVYMKYARFLPEENRRETWFEIVDRNKNMHKRKYPHLHKEIDKAYSLVYERKLLPSARSLQFAGKAMELNPARGYNCCYAPIDHPDVFSEIMFLLLSGCGVGISVQFHHVEKLPEIYKPTKSRRFFVGDSLEGWAEAVKVLIEAYTGTNGKKRLPDFDFRGIRPKGTPLKTSGGVAPGSEPLKDCLHNIQKILDRKENGSKLTPLECHHIACYISDAVLAGGIRRSSLISLFSLDDNEMMECKFGNWYETNPHLARANNSVVLLRYKIKEEQFQKIWEKIRLSGSGEPGFLFSNDKHAGTNPCGEISLRPLGFCNLVTIDTSDITTVEELFRRVRAAAFIATLQAGYTDFHFLREEWKHAAEKDALIGIGLSGLASGNIENLPLKEAAELAKDENARIAELIGISPAARCTTVKPDGTTSLVFGTSSGIHPWHSPFYIRRITIMKTEPIYQYLMDSIPELMEEDFFKPTLQAFLTVPVSAPDGAITKENESAIELLERVKFIFHHWIQQGHRTGHNYNNVSTTVHIKNDEWEKVGEWLWDNRYKYTALSFLPHTDHSYIQTPFETIDKERYNKMLEFIKTIDLTKIVETHDLTTLKENIACTSGACEIT